MSHRATTAQRIAASGLTVAFALCKFSSYFKSISTLTDTNWPSRVQYLILLSSWGSMRIIRTQVSDFSLSEEQTAKFWSQVTDHAIVLSSCLC